MKKPITLDQKIDAYGLDMTEEQLGADALIPCKLGLEPMGAGVRVTARTEDGEVLWGFVASTPTMQTHECLVGVYERLRELLQDRGVGPDAGKAEPEKVTQDTINALEEVSAQLNTLRKSLDVKRVSEATGKRAELIGVTVRDVARMLALASKA